MQRNISSAVCLTFSKMGIGISTSFSLAAVAGFFNKLRRVSLSKLFSDASQSLHSVELVRHWERCVRSLGGATISSSCEFSRLPKNKLSCSYFWRALVSSFSACCEVN